MIARKRELTLRQTERVFGPPLPPKNPEPMEGIYALLIAFQSLSGGRSTERGR